MDRTSEGLAAGVALVLGGLAALASPFHAAGYVAICGGAVVSLLSLTPAARVSLIPSRLAAGQLSAGGPPSSSYVYVSAVSARIYNETAIGFTLMLRNDSDARVDGVKVDLTIDRDGSSVSQARTVLVPAHGETPVVVDASFPLADGVLRVQGAVKHEGEEQPFCFKYAQAHGASFVPCADDLKRHYRLRVDSAQQAQTIEHVTLLPGSSDS